MVPKKDELDAEADASLSRVWDEFCSNFGYRTDQAGYACRIAFMTLLSGKQRKQAMAEVSQTLSRKRSGAPLRKPRIDRKK